MLQNTLQQEMHDRHDESECFLFFRNPVLLAINVACALLQRI